MVNNLVFRWPKSLFLMVLGAHGIYIYTYMHIHHIHVVVVRMYIFVSLCVCTQMYTSISMQMAALKSVFYHKGRQYVFAASPPSLDFHFSIAQSS